MNQLFSIVFTLSLGLAFGQEKSADFLNKGLQSIFFEILVDQGNSEKVFEQDSTVYIISQNFFCLLNDSVLQSNFVDSINGGEIKKANKKLVFLPYEKLFLISPNRYLIFEEITFTNEGKLKLSFIIDGLGYSENNPRYDILLAQSELGSIVVSDLKIMTYAEIKNLKIIGLLNCNY